MVATTSASSAHRTPLELSTRPAATQSVPSARSFISYREDCDGVPYAAEIVDADEWEEAFTEPPPVDVADVRVVRLGSEHDAENLPRWLGVEPPWAELSDAVTESLWLWSPHYRPPSSPLDDFLRAGVVALRHPEPPPIASRHQLDALASFARNRAEFVPFTQLRHGALERWLHARFAEPERFAEAVLLARLEELDPVLADEVQFLQRAQVPDDSPVHRELRCDRSVLLESLSCWSLLEGDLRPDAPLKRLREWRSRYRRAYTAVYREAVAKRDRFLMDSLPIELACNQLDSLDLPYQAASAQSAAISEFRRAAAAVRAIPDHPDPNAPCSGGGSCSSSPLRSSTSSWRRPRRSGAGSNCTCSPVVHELS